MTIEEEERKEVAPSPSASTISTNATEKEEGVAPLSYSYAELLERVSAFIIKNHPNVMADRKNWKLEAPHIIRGKCLLLFCHRVLCVHGKLFHNFSVEKKSIWVNFPQICAALHRHPDHLTKFIKIEFRADTSIDGMGRMEIKGKITQKVRTFIE
jgi:translation initiation factor 2 beta subunit (eIF-2beta)/eIF-5